MRKLIAAAFVAAVFSGCGLIPNETGNTGNNSANNGGGGGGADMTAYMQVSDLQFSYIDVGALKEGDWCEHETKSTTSGTTSTYKAKQACVKIEGNNVWIETSAVGYEGYTYLVSVDKTSRKANKAYAGKAGAEAKEIKIAVTPTGGAAGTTNYTQKTTGTVKISKDTVTVKGTAFDCEKTDSDIKSVTTVDGKESKADMKSVTWVSEKVPFRMYWDESQMNKKVDGYDVKVEGKPSVRGNTVKMTSTTSGNAGGQSYTSTSETNLIGWGTDAKMTVKLPAAGGDKK